MLSRKTFYPGQHVSTEDLNELVLGNITIIKDLLSDFQPRTSKCILTESSPSSGGLELLVTPGTGLVLNIAAGTAYLAQDKLKLELSDSFTLLEEVDIYGAPIVMPTGTQTSNVTRIDLIGIRYQESLTGAVKTISFLDTSKNTFKRSVPTEILFGGVLSYIQGQRSDALPIAPTAPSSFFTLAEVHLRDSIPNYAIVSGDLVDTRKPFLYNYRIDTN